MKSLFKTSLAALGFAVMATGAFAADWTPPGPIKLMIAFAAGGGADTQARMIAEELEASTGWQIIPEQVTGKGGLNAVNALKNEPADGSAIAMIVTETLGYNLAAAGAGDPSVATAITTTAGSQMAVVSLASSGYKTLGDVIAAAKGGAEIRFGVMSPSLADLAYVIGKENGVEFNIISVRGGKAVMNGLNAGDMDVGFGAGIQAKAVAAGDMIELASAKSGPLAGTPDAPNLSDFGVMFPNDTMFMLAGPANMDPAAREAIAMAVAKVVNAEGSKAGGFINKAFGGIDLRTGDELDALIAKAYSDAGGLLEASAE
ncbi:MAG: tripartite tricarboxylate transporter substrate-binding protein [Pseudomonadota bacterium]